MAITSTVAGTINQAASLISRIAGAGLSERDRQALADDDQFFRDDVVCFFELRDDGVSYLFPLVNGILSYAISEPFAAQVIPTLNSGLGVEEQGIVQRRLSISGHTGVAAQPLPIGRVPKSSSTLPTNYVDRGLADQVLYALSGQKHFQYLQDTVFRAYSNLKRDPKTAETAELLFHNPREREHWRVVPMSFSLSRQSGSHTYPFSIDLTIVGPAQPKFFPLAAVDKSLLQTLTDDIAEVTDAMANLAGAIDDLTRLQNEFKVFGQKVAGIIDAAGTIVQSGQSFLAGTKQLLNIPLASVFALFNLTTTLCALYADAVAVGNSVADWPESVMQRFRGVMYACDQLLSQGQVFDTQLSGQLATLAYQPQQPVTGTPNTVIATSFAQVRRAGSADLSGTASQAAPRPPPPRPYLSVRHETVRKGDTLTKIAARTLGSGLLWRDIARLNQIAPPWSVAADAVAVAGNEVDGQSGLLTYGTDILIPSTQPPAAQAGSPVVLGAKPTVSADEQAFGRDWLLTRISGAPGEPLYDLTLSETGEISQVAGPDVVTQSVEQNLVHQRGDVTLFPDVGLESVVGTGATSVDGALIRYRITQALLADPRVAGVSSLAVGPGVFAGDALLIDATLVLSDGTQAGVQVAA